MARRVGAASSGSTSVHLLVAGVGPGGLETMADDIDVPRLGAAARGTGSTWERRRDQPPRQPFLGTSSRLGRPARRSPIVHGTEPLRRLSDATGRSRGVLALKRHPPPLLEHEEERFADA